MEEDGSKTEDKIEAMPGNRPGSSAAVVVAVVAVVLGSFTVGVGIVMGLGVGVGTTDKNIALPVSLNSMFSKKKHMYQLLAAELLRAQLSLGENLSCDAIQIAVVGLRSAASLTQIVQKLCKRVYIKKRVEGCF